ncbi:MAG: hypothetical protein IT463_08450 [Planctomycetes bacterium]|nr:hypothetical protein [Planctomycetota bacterium]
MPRPEIFESLKNDFVLCSLYTDDPFDPRPAVLLQEFAEGDLTVPLYVVVDHDGNELSRLGWPAHKPVMEVEEFAKMLEDGKKEFAAANKR